MLVWSLTIFYVTLASFILYIGPDRIAQAMYDFAQKISHLRFGWMILTGLLCQYTFIPRSLPVLLKYWVVLTSFPPCIGHTTVVTLCGFAYGLKGFLVAGPASIVRSAIAFVTLRLLFSRRIKKWSSSNEKWQALEAVIVSRYNT